MFEGTAKFEGAPLLGEYLYLKFVNSRLLQFSVLLSFCLAEGLFLIIGLKTEFLLFAVCFLSFYTFFWAFVVVDRLLLARLIRHFEFLVSIAVVAMFFIVEIIQSVHNNIPHSKYSGVSPMIQLAGDIAANCVWCVASAFALR